jgi:hypothetical protein
LSLVTLGMHNDSETTASYGDIQPGFAPAQLRRMLQKAGFAVDTCAIACREKRQPHFEVITAFAHKSPKS